MCKSWSDTPSLPDPLQRPPLLTPCRKLLLELQGLWVCPNPRIACAQPLFVGLALPWGGLAPLALGAVPANTLADKSWGDKISPPGVLVALGMSLGSGCG